MRCLLIASSLALTASAQPVALLHIQDERSVFSVSVDRSAQLGYVLDIRCISNCKTASELSEAIGDAPMGLFDRDQDGLVFSLWSAGSSYRVRVYRVQNGRIGKVAELSSRGRPDFLTDDKGRSAIRTFENESGVDPPKAVIRSYQAGRFVLVR